MSHYALAPLLLLDYAKNTSYTVFCSICSTSFSLVVDLQNHLSVHLHLDVELRGGLIHFDANLMSSSAYGNVNPNEEGVEPSPVVGHGLHRESVEIMPDDENFQTNGTHKIIEECDGSNSYQGASDNSKDFSVILDGTHEETCTDSTEFNDDSYTSSVGLIKLDFSEHDDSTNTVNNIKIKEDLPVTTENAGSGSASINTESMDRKINIGCDLDDPKDPFVRNFGCSSCSQKFVNFQSCLSHYSKGTCVQNGRESGTRKMIDSKNLNEDSIASSSSSSSSSSAALAYRCSSCTETFSTIEEFSVHCRGHSIHNKFTVDFHRKPKRINPRATAPKKKTASKSLTKKKETVKITHNTSKTLKDPFKFAFKEPDILLCHTCNTQYENIESCCEHLKIMNSKPLICTLCGKLFKIEQVRDYHQKLPHVIPCNRCLIWFSDASSLSLHNRAYHRVHQDKEKNNL